jgi:thioredoxin 1
MRHAAFLTSSSAEWYRFKQQDKYIQNAEDMMADTYIDVTSQDFAEKVLTSPLMVIVNFSAENSTACQILEPEFVAISKEYQGRINFAKVNVEKQADIINQWNIDGVPTLIFFKGGQELHRIKGIMMRDKLRRQIEGALLAN